MKTMRAPSRHLPPHRQAKWPAWLLVALALGVGGWFYASSHLVRYLGAAVFLGLCACTAVMNGREKRRFAAFARTRENESLCNFARSFERRRVDTWVIRAVHQEIQELVHGYAPRFPVRASDRLLQDLHIDADDVEDLIRDIAGRCRRSLENTERNPCYGKLDTVSDLVYFIDAQPHETMA